MKPRGRKKPRKIPTVLTADEQARLLGQLEPADCSSKLRNLVLLRLMLNTGLRARELREALLSNLDWNSGRLKVKGKGGKERSLWLSQEDLSLLQDWLDLRNKRPAKHDFLFTSLDGSKPICGRWLRKLVARLGDQAGIAKEVHPHTLRHTFATDLLRKTKNLRLVQKALGHEDIATTTIYTHIVDEELEEAMINLRNGK